MKTKPSNLSAAHGNNPGFPDCVLVLVREVCLLLFVWLAHATTVRWPLSARAPTIHFDLCLLC